MPALDDLPPDQLAALTRGTKGALLVVVRELLDKGLDVMVFVEPVGPRCPRWSVRVLGLRGDVIVSDDPGLPIAWREIDERTRLEILLLWVGEIRESQDRWWHSTNRWLKARGLPEVP